MKKIMFVSHKLDRGGAQKMLVYVANTCAEEFEETILLSLYDENIDFVVNNKVRVETLNKGIRFPTVKRKIINKIKDNMSLIKNLRAKLIETKPDLICSFGVNTIFICSLAGIGLGIKITGSERRSPINLPFFWKQISKVLYPTLDGMIFQLEEVQKYYGKRVESKSEVIPNPYVSDKLYKPCNTESRVKVITAAAARLEHEKGFDVLIKAFKEVKNKYPDYKLVIYGKGDWKYMYGDLLKQLNLNNSVEFPGIVDNVADAVYNSEVFVLSSRFEGIPNALLEVMGAGVPTVSCDCPPGGPRFLTYSGRRGLLVPINDYKALAESICKIISDYGLSSRLSISALEVRKELDPKRITKMWIEFFVKTLQR